MTQVRAIKFFFPDYHYIICKYPLEFADYKFEDAVLEWCYTVKDHRFCVFVFREGVIKDYKEPANITEFYYGGTGKIERVQKNLNADSQPFWSNQIVYELRFERKVFYKDAWIEFIYKYFETHLPGLNTNPQQYLFAGCYPEYCQIFEPIYTDMSRSRLEKEAEMSQGKDKKGNMPSENLDTPRSPEGCD